MGPKVVGLSCSEVGVTEKVLHSPDIYRIGDRPKSASGTAKTMQINREAQPNHGTTTDCVINGPTSHRGSLCRRPKSAVHICTRDFVAEPAEININELGQHVGNWKFHRALRLGIGGRNVEQPTISDFDQVLIDRQSG